MKNEKYIYLCGPTVYNKVHIGNMRPIVTFDLILRGMKKNDPSIKLIHNITDIDDKIIQRAKEEKTSEDEVVEKYTNFYLDILKKYNIETIDYIPKVSEKIEFISQFINELNEKGFVYETDGSYYFRTSKLNSYGEVSNNRLDNLIDQNEDNLNKENHFDFALWKNKTDGKRWTTLQGEGRPGWHTECAAFIYEKSKDSILIHGGGIDLKFPHHENENAQFRALTNQPICHQWLHIGIINNKNQKMSKSIGNIIFADDFLNKYENASDLFRLLILSTSTSSVIELNDDLCETLIKKLNQINKIINCVLLNDLENKRHEIDTFIINDLSQAKFSKVYKSLNEKVKNYNNSKSNNDAVQVFNLMKFLGFTNTRKTISSELKSTYKKWLLELDNKNYIEADKLRKILMDNGLI